MNWNVLNFKRKAEDSAPRLLLELRASDAVELFRELDALTADRDRYKKLYEQAKETKP